MNNFFTLLIQSSVAMVLFYLVYWFLLRKETFYNTNRFFLLLSLLSSTLLPIIPIQYTVFVEAGITNSTFFAEIGNAFKGIQPYTDSGFKEGFSLSWVEAFLLIYFTGVAIFMFRLLVQTAILCVLIIKNKTKSIGGLRIVESEKYGLPFSFFNIVYINPKFHNKDILPEILAHEKVHIREKHWVDLLIIELLTVIFWFNPIIWFFEHSIKLNHEFLADNGVISTGSHIGKYQALLVNQLMGMQIIGITNNLNYSINSNRLKMMTKQKTPKIRAIKLVWAMPVIAFLLFAFAEPNYTVVQANSAESYFDQTSDQRITKLSGTVVDENEKGIPGVSIVIEGTSQGIVTDLDGKFQIGLAKNANLVLSYVGKETLHFTAKELFLSASENITIKITMRETAIYLDPDKFFKGKWPPPPPPINEGLEIPPPPINGSENIEEEMFIVVEEMPGYPGSYVALGKYVNDMQLKLAKSKHIKGKAKVAFTIDVNGKTTDIRILEKDNELAGKAAATIVMNMETWSPGFQRGKAVPVSFVLPVEF